jgi:hypothetical protein
MPGSGQQCLTVRQSGAYRNKVAVVIVAQVEGEDGNDGNEKRDVCPSASLLLIMRRRVLVGGPTRWWRWRCLCGCRSGGHARGSATGDDGRAGLIGPKDAKRDQRVQGLQARHRRRGGTLRKEQPGNGKRYSTSTVHRDLQCHKVCA